MRSGKFQCFRERIPDIKSLRKRLVESQKLIYLKTHIKKNQRLLISAPLFLICGVCADILAGAFPLGTISSLAFLALEKLEIDRRSSAPTLERAIESISELGYYEISKRVQIALKSLEDGDITKAILNMISSYMILQAGILDRIGTPKQQHKWLLPTRKQDNLSTKTAFIINFINSNFENASKRAEIIGNYGLSMKHMERYVYWSEVHDYTKRLNLLLRYESGEISETELHSQLFPVDCMVSHKIADIKTQLAWFMFNPMDKNKPSIVKLLRIERIIREEDYWKELLDDFWMWNTYKLLARILNKLCLENNLLNGNEWYSRYSCDFYRMSRDILIRNWGGSINPSLRNARHLCEMQANTMIGIIHQYLDGVWDINPILVGAK